MKELFDRMNGFYNLVYRRYDEAEPGSEDERFYLSFANFLESLQDYLEEKKEL